MTASAALDVPIIPDLPASMFRDVDLFGPQIKADPSALFSEWAQEPPFYVLHGGRPNVVICRHAHVNQAFTDYETFSALPRAGWGADTFDYWNRLPSVGESDPPDHTRLRRLMQPAFMPRRVTQLQDRIQLLLNEQVEEVAAKGAFDMMADFAQPLTRRILLGAFFEFPQEDWPIFIEFSNSLHLAAVPPGVPKPKEYLDKFNRCREYCQDLIEARRRNPQDDLVGAIISAHDDAATISAEELFATLLVLFAGGLGTTAGSQGLSILRLCRHPDQLALLQRDPSLINSAIEECLRIDSLGNFRHRFVMRDGDIGGTPIYRGMIAHISMGAGNYDPAVYPDPGKFDITRNPKGITTFGYGAHICIGHALARAVLRMVIGRLAERFPHIRLADPNAIIEYGGMPTERMPIHIPLRVD